MKTIKIIIERGNDGLFSAYIAGKGCKFGCIGEGRTAKEAELDFLQGIEDIKQTYNAQKMSFPEYRYKFTYDISSFLSYYAYAFSLAGLERITGVNQRQLSHYLNGVRVPSGATARKIEKSIKEFASEIINTSFVSL